MQALRFDHVHLQSSGPDATAGFFEPMFNAEITLGIYPPGTLYPGRMRIMRKVGGQKTLIAPPRPHEPKTCPAVSVSRAGAFRVHRPGPGHNNRGTARQRPEYRGETSSRDAELYWAFIRGPDGIMVELVEKRTAS